MAKTEAAERSGRLSRARIVEIAFDHFAAHGYRGASMAKVAAEVGISQPGLLHHFPSKALLLQAVLEERDNRDLAAVGMEFERMREMRFVDLLHFFRTSMNHRPEKRNMAQLWHMMAAEATTPDHPAHSWVVRRTETFRAFFASAVQRGIDSGELRADVDPVAVASLFVGMFEGLELHWLLDPAFEVDATFAMLIDMLEFHTAADQPAKSPVLGRVGR
jgi:AcrR family transcriptional regulator